MSSALEAAAVDDVEGVVVSVRELDGIAYGLRELPMQLRGLGEEAFRAGYLAAIRGECPDDGSRRFGLAVASVAGDLLYQATRGLTVDERENPYAHGLR